VELDAIAPPELEQIERLGNADLVIGILDGEGQEQGGSAVETTREALTDLSEPLRAVVVSNNGTHSPSEENSQQPIVLSCSLPLAALGETPQQSISNAYRRVFAVGGKLGVRACGVIVSRPQTATRRWIYRLVQPVLDLGFDLVAPCYTRQKMEGLLNRSVLSPLHQALYGERLQNPMGPDFGLSGKLLQKILRQDLSRRGAEANALASIASSAASGGFQVCESHLGVRTQRPTDWSNLSSLLAEVLGAAFLEMEGRATQWQSVRGSKILPRFGAPETPPADSGTTAVDAHGDVHGMIESFQLGTRNLQDIWGLILPPTTLLELRRLSRLPEDRFRLPDNLWARVVYDFALGHRLRTISRDHLLRSITPLYLGWIASYTLEMQTAGLGEVDSRIERLAKAYEDNKSYLVSRWRWPDRFNP
jgi:glucosylglycerate synthase